MATRLPILAALLLAAGCGGGDGSHASNTDAGPRDTGAGESGPPCVAIDGGVPCPGDGNQVNIAFNNLEPNDTPAEATPLGIARSGDLDLWVDDNTIGGAANPADYFVFESGPVASDLLFNMCFSTPITGLTASLWQVDAGAQVMPPVGSWTLDGSCATNYSAPLVANGEYLLGVFATGGPGMYEA